MAMCDVIDLDLEDSPPLVDAVPVQPDDTQLRQAIKNLMLGKDLSTISLKALRLDLEKGFGVTLEARKNDIRQLAQELVVEAQHAPPAPATPQAVEPAAKKRRIGAGMVQAQPEAQPASPVKTKAPKRKAPPSAYKLWSLEHRAIVVEELQQELQRKPTFAEISKAVPERWKAIDQAEKAMYEEKAKVAKVAQAEELLPARSARGGKAQGEVHAEGRKPGKGRGKGKGKKKDGEEPVMTRADFFRQSPTIRCAFDVPGVKASDSSMELVARMFKSQGLGYFSAVKFQLPMGEKEVTVQAQVVMNVAGSKHWEDGEGFEDALKSLELQASQAAQAMQIQDAPSGADVTTADTAVATTASADLTQSAELEEAAQIQDAPSGADVTAADTAVALTTASADLTPSAELEEAAQIQDAPSGADVTAADTAVATTASADLTPSAELEEAVQIQDAPSGADVTAADTAVALTTASADLTPAELEEAAHIQDASFGADLTAADTAVDPTASANLTQTEPRACDPEDAVHESAGLGGA